VCLPNCRGNTFVCCHAASIRAVETSKRNLPRQLALDTYMPIKDLSHITFIVRDVERMAKLLCEGLGAEELYDSAGTNFSRSREKFFMLGGVWLAAMEGQPTQRSYRHVAFKIDVTELPLFEARLRALGVEMEPSRPRVEGEGLSLYFYDFDNNLFELHTGTLEQRLKRYAQ